MKRETRRFVICVRNDHRSASLEVRKIHPVWLDHEAQRNHCLRVIDESGEDYLYPKGCFIPVELPQPAKNALLAAA